MIKHSKAADMLNVENLIFCGVYSPSFINKRHNQCMSLLHTMLHIFMDNTPP